MGSIFKNYKIILLSKESGIINWSKVDKTEFDGVLIKCGSRSTDTDEYFEKNVKACINYKIPFGIFFTSNANTVEQFEEVADYINNLISPYKNKLSLPVYYSLNNSQKIDIDIVNDFIEQLEGNGYKIGVYIKKEYYSYIKNRLNNNISIWIENNESNNENQNEKYDMIKSKKNLKISGIEQNLNFNFCFLDLSEEIKMKNNINDKTIEELTRETLEGKYDNNGDREKKLGGLFKDVQDRINDLV